MKLKGSTVCIIAMYAGWIVYIIAQIVCYAAMQVFLPFEITVGTAAVFVVETIELARLKMAKEGVVVKNRTVNAFIEQLGLKDLPSFDLEIEEINRKTEGAQHAQQTDEP